MPLTTREMKINRTLMTLIFKISADLNCDYQPNPCLAGRQVCHLRSIYWPYCVTIG